MISSIRQAYTAKSIGLSFFYMLCLFVAGCNQQEQSPEQKPQYDLQKITIGLIPELDVFTQKKRYKPLAEYLSKELGIPVEIKSLSRYRNIIDNFKELGLDAAFFGSFTGAMAIKKLGVEPLVRPEYVGGASTYYGMVFVKKGSGIKTAQDMHRKRMVFVDRATTAGYLLPLYYLKSLGIKDYRVWFKEYYFSGTHEGAINDVLNGVADVGAAKSTVFYSMVATNLRVSEELEVLATSPHVPANGLSVRNDLPSRLKEELKKKLLLAHHSADGREALDALQIHKFIETTVADYQPVLDYATSIGIDLNTYEYIND
jgi:phosphonate transport system substrate-binding protein